MKILRILKAKLRNKSDIKEEWYHERLKICETCPFNSKNTDRENKKTFKYKLWNLLNLHKHFCTICGCEIKAKASDEMEECSMVELDKEPKWKRII